MVSTATRRASREHTITTTESEPAQPTRIEVTQVDGRARISRMAHGALIAARPLRTSGRHVRMALVGIRTALLAGDALELQIRVGAGVTLEIVEPTGLVAYNGEGRRAAWHADIEVGESAALTWDAQPFVAAQGSNAHRFTVARLAAGARLLVKENLVFGRSGESGVCLHSRTDVSQQGQSLLVEELTIDEITGTLPGILAPGRVLGTVIAAGWRPQGDRADPRRLDLAAPGALYRVLDRAAHAVEDTIEPLYRQWRRDIPT